METKVNILEEKECLKTLKIEVPGDKVLIEIENMYNNLQKVAEVPGFRAGKAPRNMIEKYFKNKVEKEVLEKLVADAYTDAIKSTNFSPIDYPNISELKFEVGKPLEFKAQIEVKPEVKIKEYKGIKIKKEPVDIKPEEIDKTIKFLQERNAEFVTIEGKPIAEGHFAAIDFTGFIDGKEAVNLKTDNYILEIGSHKILPEIENGLIGVNLNEQKEITVDYKPDFQNKELAGKKVTYKVTVKSIREKKLPVLDDEFAKDVGDFKTLADLRSNIETKLKEEAENKEKVRITNAIIDEIVKSVAFSVPPTLVKNEAEHLNKDFESRMKSQNMTYEALGKTKEEIAKQYDEMAVNRVKAYLILEEIAKLEKIEVKDEEIDNEIKGVLARAGKEADSWKDYLNSEKGRSNVKGQLRQDKTLDLLYKEAKLS